LKGQKCIYTKHKRSTRYIFISKKETQNFLKSLDAKIKSQYIYFAPIETNRLIIREFKLLDANDYYYVFKSKKVCKYLSFSRLKSKKEAVKAITKATNDYQNKLIFKLAIELKLEQKVIGYIGLSRYDLTEDTCQIVYAISEKYWRQGYTSEAVRVFVEYLKQNGKKLIIAGHVEENIHSGKVLLKNGFKRSPHLDHQMIIHRTPKNIKIYTIDERN
jgi:ribosomal-protein-alanine N-acetyltransferase